MPMKAFRLPVLAPWLIACMGVALYANSLWGAFILDDVAWIVRNPRIEKAWPPGEALSGTSRPLVQWTFAMNRALGNPNDVRGYHAVNMVVHILAGLALWGLARRVFPLMLGEALDRSRAEAAGLAATLIWLAHPLHTESVTYVVQRAESMMGMFAFLTLYAMWRGHESGAGRLWYVVAVIACWLAALTKMTMVTLPLVALLMDRVFLAGDWDCVRRRRGWMHAGLFGSWLILLWLTWATRHEWGDTAGYDVSGVTTLDYVLTQPEVILRYLRLSLWPTGLCLLYDWPFDRPAVAIWTASGALVLMAVAGVWLYRRYPRQGVWWAWIILFLAPTSSVIPLLHPIFEHRMYVPLVGLIFPIVALVVLAGKRWPPAVHGVGFVIVTVLLAGATIRRNADYRTEVSIWEDTVSKSKSNARARYALGLAYATAHEPSKASEQFARALELRPDWADPHHAWGQMLYQNGDVDGARDQFESALKSDPTHAASWHDLGVIVREQGKLELAARCFERAAFLSPEWMSARSNWLRVRAELDARPSGNE